MLKEMLRQCVCVCAVSRDGGCKYCKKYCEKAYCTVILHTSGGVARMI